MRWFLYPSNVSNLILASLAFFLQVRNVNNTHSLALLCQGPCKFLGAWYCFNGYVWLLIMALVNGVLNMHTLYYRMITIKFLKNFNYQVVVFCGWYAVPLFVMVLSYIPPTNFDFVYLETLQNHPDYDYERYKNFGGFANSHSIYQSLVTFSTVSMSWIAPVFGFYWRRQTLKILDQSYRSLSAHSIAQFRMLIQGLGLQMLLPVVCYVPMTFFYIYNKYSETPFLVSQYTLMIMLTLPAAIDPILQILFIIPYRRAVKSWFSCRCGKNVADSLSPKQNTIGEWQRRKSSQNQRNIVVSKHNDSHTI